MTAKACWYPIIISKELKSNTKHKFKVFNEPFILFRDKHGYPVCIEDRCPHRGTPLSEGRVINGEIECAYHGWRFGSGGACKFIPTEAAISQIDSRFKANIRTCIEWQGVIWVWPENTLPVDINNYFQNINSLNETGYQYLLSSWDVNVPHDLLLENLFDLSHLPFVHHFTLSKRSKAQAINFTKVDDPGSVFAYKAKYEKFSRKDTEEIYKFIAPHTAEYEFKNLRHDTKTITQFICVPLDTTTTRIFNYTYMRINPYMFKLVNNPVVLFLGKPLAKMITNQDTRILLGQNLSRKRQASLSNQLVSADLMVANYRRWFNQNCNYEFWFESYDKNRNDNLNKATFIKQQYEYTNSEI